MPYEKLNLKNDTVLTEEHLAHLEDGIADAVEKSEESISIQHEWDGTVLTIKSNSGESSADLKGPQGETGPAGPQGIQGPKGEAGISISDIYESGGGRYGDGTTYKTLTVLFTDGTSKQFNVYDGAVGPRGETGPQGNPTTVNGKTGESITLNASDVGAASASHTQAAGTISAGIFAGQVVANSAGQAASTSLLRNSKLVTTDTSPTIEGEIVWLLK